MPSQIAQIADAVKTALNAATLSQEVAAVRVYVPVASLEAAEDLHVFVMPVERALSKLTRSELQSDIRVDIAVVKRITADPKTEAANAEVDPLLQLTEEIAELFGPGAYGPGKWLGTENPAIFDQERLQNSKTFVSVVSLTFKLF